MKVSRFAVVAFLLMLVMAVAVAPSVAQDTTLPRNETLYFNGQQWGAVVGWNPYSSNNNNALAISQGDNARVVMFETPYLYNMLDGQVYPLLADGPYEWNEARTELTFHLKAAAHWSDGTPVTAEDVAYTWATHVQYNTPTGKQSVAIYRGSGRSSDRITVTDRARQLRR